MAQYSGSDTLNARWRGHRAQSKYAEMLYFFLQICDILTASPNNEASYKKLAQFNAIVLEKNNETCMDYNYGKMITELRNVEWSANKGGGNHDNERFYVDTIYYLHFQPASKMFDHYHEFYSPTYSFKISARQWMFQTCTEFGFYTTSSGTSDIFGNHFELEFFVQQCMDIFGQKQVLITSNSRRYKQLLEIEPYILF